MVILDILSGGVSTPLSWVQSLFVIVVLIFCLILGAFILGNRYISERKPSPAIWRYAYLQEVVEVLAVWILRETSKTIMDTFKDCCEKCDVWDPERQMGPCSPLKVWRLDSISYSLAHEIKKRKHITKSEYSIWPSHIFVDDKSLSVLSFANLPIHVFSRKFDWTIQPPGKFSPPLVITISYSHSKSPAWKKK